MESVYLEATFVSYLVARSSRDVIIAGHQQTTRAWWDFRRQLFDCCISQVVIDEASAGDPSEVKKRLKILRKIPILEVTAAAELLTNAIIASGVIPPRAVRDAAHIAVAAVHEIDYLLPGTASTWQTRRSCEK